MKLKLKIGTDKLNSVYHLDPDGTIPHDRVTDQPGARVIVACGDSERDWHTIQLHCVVGGRDAFLSPGPFDPELYALAGWAMNSICGGCPTDWRGARDQSLRRRYPSATVVDGQVTFRKSPRAMVLALPDVAELREEIKHHRSLARHHANCADSYLGAEGRATSALHAVCYGSSAAGHAETSAAENGDALALQGRYVELVNRHCAERGMPPIYRPEDATRSAWDNAPQAPDMMSAVAACQS